MADDPVRSAATSSPLVSVSAMSTSPSPRMGHMARRGLTASKPAGENSAPGCGSMRA